jgi:hypothetical protein
MTYVMLFVSMASGAMPMLHMVPPLRASGKDALEASAWPGAVAMVGSMAYLMDDEADGEADGEADSEADGEADGEAGDSE